MSSAFTELNGFHQSADGVFSKNEERAHFNYTDGLESELALKNILTSCSDLSSDSAELDEHIFDWPSEYHLSSVRANLLRCLDLSGVKRVLELGGGCGSITRYLGEQTHLEIDSVEGSEARAALAALRCADLPNVTISTANFNQVAFPDGYYDLVLFVGVTEYAGRFSDRETDQEALQDILQLAQKANTDDGVTLVAIENRTGLKYMLGAAEDHYGRAYVGIEDYPESTGIRTYTKPEWVDQIAQANFSKSVFLYPFPDYKIPTQIIHDKALEVGSENSSAELLTVFTGIKSRDYLKPFDLGEQERYLWQGLYEAGSLADHANSFLILLSNSVTQLADFDIKQFAEKDFETRYTPVSAIKENESNDDNVDQYTDQAVELKNQLNLIHQSRSWRFLTKFRPILKMLGVGRQ